MLPCLMILSRSQKRKSSESVHHIRGQNKNKWAKVSSTRILGVAFIPAVSYPGDSRHTAIQFVLKCRQKKRRKTLVEKNSDEDWSTNNLENRKGNTSKGTRNQYYWIYYYHILPANETRHTQSRSIPH